MRFRQSDERWVSRPYPILILDRLAEEKSMRLRWEIIVFLVFAATVFAFALRGLLTLGYALGVLAILLLILLTKPPEPDWLSFLLIRLVQVFLGVGVLLFGFPFEQTAATIFLIEMVDSTPLGGEGRREWVHCGLFSVRVLFGSSSQYWLRAVNHAYHEAF